MVCLPQSFWRHPGTRLTLVEANMHRNPKIKDLDNLATILSAWRDQGKKIIHCHGVFDLLHVGHVRHFEEARAMGDLLVVTLTPDEYVNKGPHRPAFPQHLRAEVVAALDVVDYVAMNRWPTAVRTIEVLRPHIYAKGPDYRDASQDVTGGITLEEEAVRSVGGEITFTDDITFSASGLLNRFLPMFPTEVNGYLDDFRQRRSAREIVQYLDRLCPLTVLVVGETILDEYIYCDAIGKSAKEPILAMRYLSREMNAGGILAIGNHVADFCNRIELLTYLGTTNPHEEFVRRRLKPDIRPTFIYKSDSPTIIKRRYIENYPLSKVLEVYEINDELLNEQEDDAFCAALEARLPECDLVIVADYGHGLISPRAAELLANKAPFLAVNTQMNAANIGFHTVSKYRRADYICIQEGEIRLDYRSRKGELKDLVRDLSRRLACSTVMVTRGKHGTLLYRDGAGFFECPSFAVHVVDRMGAGDAVLAVTSLCTAQHVPPDVIGFIGNLVGAQAVTIVGNSASIDRVGLLRSIESLLK